MSEYQYYEFRAVDRPLTRAQMDVLRAYSSRADITPQSFVNIYNWGDFKGDPDAWMQAYFDAFLYLANWGTRILKLRVPKQLMDAEAVAPYCISETLSCQTTSEHLIFSFSSEEEEEEWTDGEGWLASLMQLRTDLMNGDYRCLYLGWLRGIQEEELDEDAPEPPVPPQLGSLNAALRSLIDFLRIDRNLVAVAQEESHDGPPSGLSQKEISKWVAGLAAKEKDSLLVGLLGGEDPYAAAALRHRVLREIRSAGKAGAESPNGERRSVGQLTARAATIEKQRRKREAAQEARIRAQRERAEAAKRQKHLQSLVGQETALWAEIEKLIATKQPKRYDEAVVLLNDLHDVAAMKSTDSEFVECMNALHREHVKKPSLIDRFRKAKLLR